jgi:hypothetical protein
MYEDKVMLFWYVTSSAFEVGTNDTTSAQTCDSEHHESHWKAEVGTTLCCTPCEGIETGMTNHQSFNGTKSSNGMPLGPSWP